MTRFIQIHALTGYSSALINRDDTGLAKRISYGGAMRTRISSQCQKRAWRMNDGPDALFAIPGVAEDVRSKDVISHVAANLAAEGMDPEILKAIEPEFLMAVYSEKAGDSKNRQPLLFGGAEISFITEKMREAAAAKSPAEAAEAFRKGYKAAMKAMREQVALASGLTAALFGRMVTSDVAANVEAAIHVAHAFTVHSDTSESDYFTVVDDLAKEDSSGAGHIGESEISSGLFYSYVVVDVAGLIANLGGDAALGAEVVRRLVRMIASVSPGAKRGSTAPYSYASTLMVETGDAQPRSLAEAFRKPVGAASHEGAEAALARHIEHLDNTYAGGETRAWLSLRNEADLPGDRADLNGVADLAARAVAEAG